MMRVFPVTQCLLLLFLFVLCGGIASAQDSDEKDTRPVRNMFESIWLLDNQTAVVPIPGTFEVDFQHRFGTWDKGYDDFWGIFAPSNMRIALNYVPVDRLMVGLGFIKNDLIWDFYGKYAIAQQGRSGGWPVSVTYYANAAVDTRDYDRTTFLESSDRWSLFNQLMIARKESDAFSFQVHASYSWFNYKDPVFDEEGVHIGRDDNGLFSAGVMGRYKLTNSFAIIAGWDFPVTNPDYFDPESNASIGIEVATSSHAFQVFLGNYNSLSPQYNATFNQNRPAENQFLLGFNITRLWNF
jgi:hypothetical protein